LGTVEARFTNLLSMLKYLYLFFPHYYYG